MCATLLINDFFVSSLHLTFNHHIEAGSLLTAVKKIIFVLLMHIERGKYNILQ